MPPQRPHPISGEGLQPQLEASGVALPVFLAAPMAFGGPGAAVLGRLRGAVGADYSGSISSGLPHPTALDVSFLAVRSDHTRLSAWGLER